MAIIKNQKLADEIRQAVSAKLKMSRMRVVEGFGVQWMVAQNGQGYIAIQKIDSTTFVVESRESDGSLVSASVHPNEIHLDGITAEQAFDLIRMVPEFSPLEFEVARGMLREWGKI